MVQSETDLFLQRRGNVPVASPNMARAVSPYRREMLAQQVERGLYREQGVDARGNPVSRQDGFQENIKTAAGNVLSSKRFKIASSNAPGAGGGVGLGSYRGGGGTLRQVPEIYSPLWLNSNLNLPRDRATINAWSRAFFALNPVVQNAVSLHSTYPISKLNIKCKNPKVQRFFEDMIEEIDLMNICVQIAQEYWLLGEAFVYAELDERSASWSRLLIQNPDYMVVKHSVVAGEPILSLRPDENLKKIVNSNRPSDIQQRHRLDPSIIEHVKRGENIPLSNFYASHIARRISPYETRGTGLVTSCFRQLMLFDKLRECFDEETEVLTNLGFKKIHELLEETEDLNTDPNNVVGTTEGSSKLLRLKKDVQIGCFDPESEGLEFHYPNETHMTHYSGEMLHFKGEKVDVCVTPNHKMWVKTKNKNYDKQIAKSLLDKKTTYKLKSNVKWKGKEISHVKILGKKIPTDLYLKILGYLASEGCLYKNFENERYDATIIMSQLTSKKSYNEMHEAFNAFADFIGKKCSNLIKKVGSGFSKDTPKEKWECRIHGKELVNHFIEELGQDGKSDSYNKKLPRWVFDLSANQIMVLLNALLDGDGSRVSSKYSEETQSFRYSTVSKRLADDVYELAFKCGFSPNINVSKRKDRDFKEYTVLWSNTNYGNEPLVYTSKSRYGAKIEPKNYEGIVWCFDVPTGLFVTRRNNKVTIQGNSKFAQADNMVNPLTLVKIGGGGENYKPTPADLEGWRDVFECHDEETEILTLDGFKKYNEVMEEQFVIDGTTDCLYSAGAVTKKGTKIACFNPETESLEYHEPSAAHLYDYDGEMYHFNNDKMDIMVTPNHRMWVKNTNKKNSDWEFMEAKDVPSGSKTRAQLSWDGNEAPEYVEVCGKKVEIDLYLEFLGYLISEGCLFSNNKGRKTIELSQSTTMKDGSVNPKYEKMKKCMDKFSSCLERNTSVRIKQAAEKQKELWIEIMSGKDLYDHFAKTISNGKSTLSYDKIVPSWIKSLKKEKLQILLDALVLGDGSTFERSNGKTAWSYYSSSKQLIDDVYEIVLKCGYSPISSKYNKWTYEAPDGSIRPRVPSYRVLWSETNIGCFPTIRKTNLCPHTKKKVTQINKTSYKGKVWCFTVPTGLFVTRRNGRVTIQGNSAQYDKDFKIFTHDAVTVERVGWNAGIIDISNDITQLLKEIYIGVMVPQVLMDGGGDVTYANGGVTLDVLRQRYLQFRNMLASWLRRKIFAPISKINEFYEKKDGEYVLVVPEVEWNHMSLFDAGDYIQALMSLAQGETPKVSDQTLYRSLGLDYADEVRKMREESIQRAINAKEGAALEAMSLTELRTLGPEDVIEEPEDDLGAGGGAALPGEDTGGGGGLDLPDLGGPPPAPGGDLGGGGGEAPPPPPPPPGEGA